MDTPRDFPAESFRQAATSLAELESKLRPKLSPRDANAVQGVLSMVLKVLREDVTQAMTTASDHAFGQGYREGRAAGETVGWARRESIAQEERAVLEREIASRQSGQPAQIQERDPVGQLLDALERDVTAGTAVKH